MPNILANGDTDFDTCHIHDTGFYTFSKISLLVEDLIIWETLLEVLTNKVTAMDNPRRIKQLLARATRIPDDHVELRGQLRC